MRVVAVLIRDSLCSIQFQQRLRRLHDEIREAFLEGCNNKGGDLSITNLGLGNIGKVICTKLGDNLALPDS